MKNMKMLSACTTTVGNMYFRIDVDVYCVEMECCDFTLEQYHQGQGDLPIAIETGGYFQKMFSAVMGGKHLDNWRSYCSRARTHACERHST